MSDTGEPWNWEGVPDESVREILRQAEIQIDALLTTSIAADQRAMTLAGVFGAVSVALFAGAATIAGLPHVDLAAIISISALSLMMLIASLICGFSGRPRKYAPSGFQPKRLMPSASDTMWMMRYVAEDLQDRITENRAVLKRIAVLTLCGYGIAVASTIVSVIGYLILRRLGV